MSKLISIIIPVCNEASNIQPIYSALKNQFESLGADFDYEMIFIDDGSIDNSFEEIETLVAKDAKVKYLQFTKNFGKEIAMTAGLKNCQGDAAIVMDADLQHPPELISEFIKRWQDGAFMVVGVKKNGHRKGLLKKIGSLVFYQTLNLIGENKLSAKTTDFRLIDREVVDQFNFLTERNRITRGLLDWLGFKKDFVYFDVAPRLSGKPTYSRHKLFKLALNSFVSHSFIPLKLAGYMGVLIILFSGPLGLFIFIDKYIFNDLTGFNFSGPAILAILNLFLTGIILSCLGLISLYIASIQNEVLNRPLYVISRKSKFQKEK